MSFFFEFQAKIAKKNYSIFLSYKGPPYVNIKSAVCWFQKLKKSFSIQVTNTCCWKWYSRGLIWFEWCFWATKPQTMSILSQTTKIKGHLATKILILIHSLGCRWDYAGMLGFRWDFVPASLAQQSQHPSTNGAPGYAAIIILKFRGRKIAQIDKSY